MRRFLLAAVLVVAATLSPTPQLIAQAPTPFGFDRLFDLQAGLVGDTNGDGLADAIAARVIVADVPSVQDMLVATNIAGR
ncbi:MAG: hypothetical protein KAY59_03875, partial [Acidobacteria bacterium]|nr:hypothetical protein [Acidobacteriota bacterium]